MKKLNVLSLFDGISCGRVALDQAGVGVQNYYASEIDKYAIQVSQNNHSGLIRLGDVTKWGRWDLDWSSIDLVIGGSPCFTGDTQILTSVGYKKIKDISIGEEVLTHAKNWKRVIRTGGQTSPVIELKAQGFLPTYSTFEHPFYARTRHGSPEWQKLGSLTKGHYVGLPIIEDEEDAYGLSDDESFVLGRYIADGHTRKDYRVKEGRANDRYWQLVLSIGNKKYFETNLKHSISKHTENVERMIFCNKRLVRIAELECGCGAINKKLSPNLLKLPKGKLEKLLEGVLSGDGSMRNGVYRVTTISIDLAKTLCLAIAKVYNVGVCIEKTVRPKTTTIEGRVVNQNDTYTISFQKQKKKTSKYFVEDGFIWNPVKSVIDTNREGEVFNLEVADDNTYIANNITVHNCQGFSFAGKQLAFDDPRSKLFFVYYDVLTHIQQHNPNVKFMLENVRMKKEYQDVITNYLDVPPVMINSALVSAQNRVRLYWANWDLKQPKDRGILLKDIIEDGEVDRDKSYCLDANQAKGGNPKQYFEKARRQLVFGGAMRGRYLVDGKRQDHKMKTAGLTKQRIEVRPDGKSNCLTSVQKDSLCIQVGEAYLNTYRERKAVYSPEGKCPTLLTPSGGYSEKKITTDNLTWRNLTPIECERLMGLPDNYTSGVSNTQRYKTLGNAWECNTLTYNFKQLRKTLEWEAFLDQ